MKLPPEAIKDFQEAYKNDFGKDISLEEAEKIGSRLLDLFWVICKPLPKKGEIKRGAVKIKYDNYFET